VNSLVEFLKMGRMGKSYSMCNPLSNLPLPTKTPSHNSWMHSLAELFMPSEPHSVYVDVAPNLGLEELYDLVQMLLFQFSLCPIVVGQTLVSISGRVVLRANDQTTTLLRALVDGLNNINQLLLILQDPVQLVVVTSSKIAHHVFVAEEEHDCHRVVELVHLLEVGHFVKIAEVDDGEVFDPLGDSVEDLVLSHTVRVAVSAKADDYEALFF
jgi:hypothetical protein